MGIVLQTAPYLAMKRAARLTNAGAWRAAFQDGVLQREIRERVIEQLYERGVDATDRVIGYYSFATAMNDPRKKYNEHYNFLDTGAFFQSMYVAWFPSSIFITANAQKEDDNLFEKYGTQIVGLTPYNREWLIQQLIERYIQYGRGILFRH